MRILPLILLAFTLTACDGVFTTQSTVNPATLAPLSSKEQALLFAADGAARQGNFAAAERDYLGAVGASTGHIEAHLALAELYEKQRQTDKERAMLERAAALQPDHPTVNYMLGKLDLDAFNYTDAVTHFDRGLKTKPDDIDLNTGKGIANDMLGNHTAAQMLYVRAMRVNSGANLAGLRTNLAMSYLLNEEPQKAIALLQPEVKKPGVSSVTRHNLALAYGILGRHAEARKVLNGEIDEETRQLTIGRLREYWKAHDKQILPLINGDKKTDMSGVAFQKKVKPVGLPANSPLAQAIKAEEAKKKTTMALGQ